MRILQFLQQKQLASVVDLAKRFHVTPATIRRDLDALEEQGNIKRFFGGVEYILPHSEYVQYRTEEKDITAAKEAIAKKAASMINDEDTVLPGVPDAEYQPVPEVPPHGSTLLSGSPSHEHGLPVQSARPQRPPDSEKTWDPERP